MKVWRPRIFRRRRPTRPIGGPDHWKNETVDLARLILNQDDALQKRFLNVFSKSLQPGLNSEKAYKQLTEQELLDMTPEDLADTMVRSDETADKVLDDAITYGLISYGVNCEDPKGNDVLHDFFATLQRKRNSMRMSLVKMFTSIQVRGEVVAEVVFGPDFAPSNLFVPDPKYVKFEEVKDDVDGPVWVMGQNRNGKFERIDAETVVFEAVNPMLEDPRGRSLMASAFPSLISSSLMLKDLREVIKNHAWVQKAIEIKILEMKEKGYEGHEIEKAVAEAKTLIKSWEKLPPGQIPVSTDNIQFTQYEGGGSGRMNFVDTTDRVYDRKSIRGLKTTPNMVGSNEFVAETSMETNSLLYALRLSSHQDTIIRVVEPLLVQVIRSQGIPGDVNFYLKRFDTWEREREAQIFERIMIGVQQAVAAGMSLPMAIKFYESVAGYDFSDELVSNLEKEYEEMLKRMEQEGDNNANSNTNRQDGA